MIISIRLITTGITFPKHLFSRSITRNCLPFSRTLLDDVMLKKVNDFIVKLIPDVHLKENVSSIVH